MTPQRCWGTLFVRSQKWAEKFGNEFTPVFFSGFFIAFLKISNHYLHGGKRRAFQTLQDYMSDQLSKQVGDVEEVSASKIANMARQLMGILSEQLEWLKRGDDVEGYSESKTKMALVISKGMQTLEDLFKRMTSHEAEKTPPTALDVRAKLEKQIGNLAKKAVTPKT